MTKIKIKNRAATREKIKMNSQLIQTLTRADVDRLIDGCLADFDFETAHKVITILNLKWDRLFVSSSPLSLKKVDYIPTIDEMREFAADLLRTVADTDMFDVVTHNHFQAEFHKSQKYLSLTFIICESSASL